MPSSTLLVRDAIAASVISGSRKGQAWGKPKPVNLV